MDDKTQSLIAFLQEQNTYNLHVRLSESQKEALEELAKSEGIKPSEWIRRQIALHKFKD